MDLGELTEYGKLLGLNSDELQGWLEGFLAEAKAELQDIRDFEEKESKWEAAFHERSLRAIRCVVRTEAESQAREERRAKRAADTMKLQAEICKLEEMIGILVAAKLDQTRAELQSEEQKTPQVVQAEDLYSFATKQDDAEKEAEQVQKSGSERVIVKPGKGHPKSTKKIEAETLPSAEYVEHRLSREDWRTKADKGVPGREPRKSASELVKTVNGSLERWDPDKSDAPVAAALERQYSFQAYKGKQPPRKKLHGRPEKDSRPSPVSVFDDEKRWPSSSQGVQTSRRTAADRAEGGCVVMGDDKNGDIQERPTKSRAGGSTEDAPTGLGEEQPTRPSEPKPDAEEKDLHPAMGVDSRGGSRMGNRTLSRKDSESEACPAPSSSVRPRGHRKATSKKALMNAETDEAQRRRHSSRETGHFKAGSAPSPRVKRITHRKAIPKKGVAKMATPSWGTRRPRIGRDRSKMEARGYW